MSKALAAMSVSLPIGSLESYEQAVNRFPMITADEERDLALRYRDQGDIEAARRLVMSHLRFVVHVARGYRGYGLPHADIIQEGNVGLMKAVKRFDPGVGVRLVSFAVHWIRAEIHEYILRNWRIVKVATTKAQRKLFFNLRSAKKRLGWMNSEEVNAVAEDLGVSSRDVLEMEERLSSRDASYDGPVMTDDEDAVFAPAGYLENLGPGPEEEAETAQTEDLEQERLQQALAALDDRSREIIRRRWLADNKTTLQELAGEFGVSAERIRQLEKAAMAKMHSAIAA